MEISNITDVQGLQKMKSVSQAAPVHLSISAEAEKIAHWVDLLNEMSLSGPAHPPSAVDPAKLAEVMLGS